MSILSSIAPTALKSMLLAVPGSNYVLLAWNFLVAYWKPIAIVIGFGYFFHLGVAHERKINDTAQLQAQVVKVTFERDNLVRAAEAANIEVGKLDNLDELNRRFLNAIQAKPIAGDCVLSDDVARSVQQPAPRHKGSGR